MNTTAQKRILIKLRSLGDNLNENQQATTNNIIFSVDVTGKEEQQFELNYMLPRNMFNTVGLSAVSIEHDLSREEFKPLYKLSVESIKDLKNGNNPNIVIKLEAVIVDKISTNARLKTGLLSKAKDVTLYSKKVDHYRLTVHVERSIVHDSKVSEEDALDLLRYIKSQSELMRNAKTESYKERVNKTFSSFLS